MKRLLLSALALVALGAKATDQYWPYEAYPLQRRVLIEQFTGTTCSNCPAAHTAISNSVAQYDASQYVWVAQHHYAGSQFVLNDSKTIAYAYQINTSAPYALACRKGTEVRTMSAPKYSPQAQTLTDQAMERNLRESTPVWLTLKGSTYNPVGSSVTIKVSGFADKNIDNLRLHLLLTENNLSAYQSGSGYMTHNGVVRAFIANPNPSAAAKTSSPWTNFMEYPAFAGLEIEIDDNGYFEKTIDYTLPSNISDASNCEIVAFVATTKEWRYKDGLYTKENYELSEVWNVTKASIIDIYNSKNLNDPLKFRLEVKADDNKYYGTMYLPIAVTLPETAKGYAVDANGDAHALTSQSIPANTPVLIAAADSIVSLTPFALDAETPSSNGLSGNFVSRTKTSDDNFLYLALQDGKPAFLPIGQTPATSNSNYYVSAGSYIPVGRAHLSGTSAVEVNFSAAPLQTVLTLTDGETYDGSHSGTTYDRIDYVRDYANTNWQAFYVPFQFDFDDLGGNFDIARIVDVKQWDDNEDGQVDRSALNLRTVESGTIKANTPYLIKAHNTGEQTISVENAAPTAATARSIDCTSTTLQYVFTGTYQTITDMFTNKYYALSGGNLRQANDESVTLKPYRWYLNIVQRTANAYIPRYVSIQVDDEDIDGSTTAIDGISTQPRNDKAYDLSGRRVNTNKNGIYIINGKKILK